MVLQFSMNRTCAPQLLLEDFIKLATGVGVDAVEIRNDISGREFADGSPAKDIRSKLDDAGLKVASVNALQRFNDWNADRKIEAEKLIRYAAELGAPGLVLCPVHNIDHGWTEEEAEKNLRIGLRALAPILNDYGLIGYVEPLGMEGSTMKKQAMAVSAIQDVDGLDVYSLCYDTFQFFRCGDTQVFPEHIGLIHVSGITRLDLNPSELLEPDRGLVEDEDRVENIKQLSSILKTGYKGFVSMEPFDPLVQQNKALLANLNASFKRLKIAYK